MSVNQCSVKEKIEKLARISELVRIPNLPPAQARELAFLFSDVHFDKLRTSAYRKLKGLGLTDTDAEENKVDVIVLAAEKATRYHAKFSFKKCDGVYDKWFYVQMNYSAQEIARKVRQMRERETELDETEYPLDSTDLNNSNIRILILKILLFLPGNLRRIVKKHYLEGMSDKEIAELESGRRGKTIKPETIRKYRNIAIRQLRRRICLPGLRGNL